MGKTDEEKQEIVAEQTELAEEIIVAEHIKARLKCNANMLRMCFEAAFQVCQDFIEVRGAPQKIAQPVFSEMALALFESVMYPEGKSDLVRKRTGDMWLMGTGPHGMIKLAGHGVSTPGVCEHKALQALSQFYRYFAIHSGEVYPAVGSELLESFTLAGYNVIRCPHCLLVFDIEKVKSGDFSSER